MLRLQELTEEESAELLDVFLALDLADELPVTTLIGLCADPNTVWADLRVGEIKTLLGLAIGDQDAILDGCAWIEQFGELPEARARVYRCVANMVKMLDSYELEDVAPFEANLILLYGAETFNQAQQLLNGEAQFFGLNNLEADMQGSQMHQQLLAAYRKVGAFKLS